MHATTCWVVACCRYLFFQREPAHHNLPNQGFNGKLAKKEWEISTVWTKPFQTLFLCLPTPALRASSTTWAAEHKHQGSFLVQGLSRPQPTTVALPIGYRVGQKKQWEKHKRHTDLKKTKRQLFSVPNDIMDTWWFMSARSSDWRRTPLFPSLLSSQIRRRGLTKSVEHPFSAACSVKCGSCPESVAPARSTGIPWIVLYRWEIGSSFPFLISEKQETRKTRKHQWKRLCL